MSLRNIITSKAFWSGISYFLCPFQFYRKKSKKSAWAKDKADLIEDWKTIGTDFRGVINNYGRH